MNVLCIMFLHTITFCHFPKTILQKLIDLFKLFGRICFFPVKMFNSEMIKIAEAAGGDDLDQCVFVAASLQPQILP